jgi:uroporphyrinogen III methyltransferase / synthase
VSSPRIRDTAARAGLGEVAFVGAGPGDEGLLTLRAVDRLAAADVVVTDQPGREALLATYCRPDVEVLDASFGEDGQPMTRANRAKLVLRAARSGRLVVRLMDGDPTTFTGLAEEIAACRKDDIPYEVVPGVPAATAVPAYAGVPLTPAGVAAFSVVHPHGARVDWSRYAAKDDTLVVLDGTDGVLAAAAGLLGVGADPQTPVAVTSSGTTVQQRTLRTTLGELADVL